MYLSPPPQIQQIFHGHWCNVFSSLLKFEITSTHTHNKKDTFEVQNQGEYQYMTLQRNYVHKLNKIFMLIVFPHLN